MKSVPAKNPFPQFSRTSAGGNAHVFLVHGLLMRSGSMKKVAKFFAENGFDTWNYDYPSSRFGIFGQGERLLGALREAFAAIPAGTKIFFITHSMGGILLRIALAKMSPDELSRIAGIVQLAPPNGGSYWPKIVKFAFPPLWFANHCLRDLRTGTDSPLRQIPLPQAFPPLLIIRGKTDMKVAQKFLPIPGWPCEILSVNCGHAAIRWNRQAFELARDFFVPAKSQVLVAGTVSPGLEEQ